MSAAAAGSTGLDNVNPLVLAKAPRLVLAHEMLKTPTEGSMAIQAMTGVGVDACGPAFCGLQPPQAVLRMNVGFGSVGGCGSRRQRCQAQARPGGLAASGSEAFGPRFAPLV
jgi:hypothetical protein